MLSRHERKSLHVRFNLPCYSILVDSHASPCCPPSPCSESDSEYVVSLCLTRLPLSYLCLLAHVVGLTVDQQAQPDHVPHMLSFRRITVRVTCREAKWCLSPQKEHSRGLCAPPRWLGMMNKVNGGFNTAHGAPRTVRCRCRHLQLRQRSITCTECLHNTSRPHHKRAVLLTNPTRNVQMQSYQHHPEQPPTTKDAPKL